MKLLTALVTAALAGRIERSVDIIECPGRCWELSGTHCTPEAGKVTIDCSEVGHVKATVDSCLFTPDNADYSQDYKVATLKSGQREMETAGCFKEIDSSTDVLSFDWTYAEAAECGWEWFDGVIADKLTFKSQLKASDNINKVTAQEVETIISEFPDNINLQCNFANTVSVTADLNGTVSEATQSASEAADVSLASSFSVQLFTGGQSPEANNFTVGESVTSKFNYDSTAAGFTGATLDDQPFGYFANKCFVENKDDITQALYLVGSHDSNAAGKSDKCTMASDPLDLHVSTSLGPEGSSDEFAIDEYSLTFDAFKFVTSSSLTLVCEFEICLKADSLCTTLSDRSTC